MGLHSEMMADDHTMRAFFYGPLVLAGGLGRDGLTKDLLLGPEGPELKKAPGLAVPEFLTNGKRLDHWIKPGNQPMTFAASGQKSDVRMEPFYRVKDERYSLYWKVS
jgi:hypothetical protein